MRSLLVLPLLLLASGFLLTSCTNPYARWYTPYSNELLPPSDDVEVIRASPASYLATIRRLQTEGYLQIGESGFNATKYDVRFAVKHAKEIGADTVVVAHKFTDTETYTDGYIEYDFEFDFDLVPVIISERRYDQSAMYFSRNLQKPKFGIYYEVLTPAEKQANETNHGLKATVVINNLPMFDAGIIPGDILLEMNGRKLITVEDFYEEDDVSLFKVLRNKRILEIEVNTSK